MFLNIAFVYLFFVLMCIGAVRTESTETGGFLGCLEGMKDLFKSWLTPRGQVRMFRPTFLTEAVL
jgi:hypothetical protein